MTKSVRTMVTRLERVEAEQHAPSYPELAHMSREQMLGELRKYADGLECEGEHEQALLWRAFVDETVTVEGLHRLALLSGMPVFLEFEEIVVAREEWDEDGD